ncbi:MAG: prepilin-type N-terminal cleavage/methylation domain-containing protein [Huintestinicola sp.]
MKKKVSFKGFTLVEVIVVMVIIAILAALLIPSLTGYIDKANEQSAIVEGRNLLTASQTIISEHYGKSRADRTKTKLENYAKKHYYDIAELAELNGKIVFTSDIKVSDVGAKVQSFTFWDGTFYVSYDVTAEEAFTVTELAVGATAPEITGYSPPVN